MSSKTIAQAHLETRIEENPEAMLQCSRHYVPKDPKGIFALKTRSTIHHDGKYVKEGSFIIVDPKDCVLADGRLMVFSINGMWHLRLCRIENETVWLESKAGKKTDKPPIVLTKKDAENHVVGFASMLIPLPSF